MDVTMNQDKEQQLAALRARKLQQQLDYKLFELKHPLLTMAFQLAVFLGAAVLAIGIALALLIPAAWLAVWAIGKLPSPLPAGSSISVQMQAPEAEQAERKEE